MKHTTSDDLLNLHVLMIREKYNMLVWFDSPHDYPFQDFYNILENDDNELMK